MRTREELYQLIDQLPDEALDDLYQLAKQKVAEKRHHLGTEEVWNKIRQLREEIKAEGKTFPLSADVVNEVREERLRQLMGDDD